ncbi:MAG: hypothetical protein IJ937_06225, partial [Treponema sp.]|nr:hypothetical protein [Treponema sp.]
VKKIQLHSKKGKKILFIWATFVVIIPFPAKTDFPHFSFFIYKNFLIDNSIKLSDNNDINKKNVKINFGGFL